MSVPIYPLSDDFDTLSEEALRDLHDIECSHLQLQQQQSSLSTLENIISNLDTVSQIGGTDAIHYSLATETLSYIAKQHQLQIDTLPSLDRESFNHFTIASLSTENIKTHATRLLDALLETMTRTLVFILEKIKSLYERVFASYLYIRNYANDLAVKLPILDGPKNNRPVVGRFITAYQINGDLTTIEDVCSKFITTVRLVAQRWAPNNVGNASKSITDSLTNLVNKSESSPDVVKKLVSELKEKMTYRHLSGNIPFAESRYEITAKEADARFNWKGRLNEKLFASDYLPGNRQLFIVLPLGDQYGKTETHQEERMVCKLYPTRSKEISSGGLTICSRKDANLIITTVLDALRQGESIKLKMDNIKPLVKALKSSVMRMTTVMKGYEVSAKIPETSNQSKQMIKEVRESISQVNKVLVFLTEPGSSIATYSMLQSKSMLDYIKKSIEEIQRPDTT